MKSDIKSFYFFVYDRLGFAVDEMHRSGFECIDSYKLFCLCLAGSQYTTAVHGKMTLS